jgi:hypothetical protein
VLSDGLLEGLITAAGVAEADASAAELGAAVTSVVVVPEVVVFAQPAAATAAQRTRAGM